MSAVSLTPKTNLDASNNVVVVIRLAEATPAARFSRLGKKVGFPS